ncbi:hypothetical protein ABID21_005010 [Pseudorhizobium tarimense]|uniref:Uncharacterized protein n=1 Tax=Pseudorhizobium tarimense TaxID=1079109 RepID=A0ABV2HEA2_9HYPH
MIGERFFSLFFFWVLFCAQFGSWFIYVRNALRAEARGVRVQGMYYLFADINDHLCTAEIRRTYHWSRMGIMVSGLLLMGFLILI